VVVAVAAAGVCSADAIAGVVFFPSCAELLASMTKHAVVMTVDLIRRPLPKTDQQYRTNKRRVNETTGVKLLKHDKQLETQGLFLKAIKHDRKRTRVRRRNRDQV
jgi:hypothetical protein